MIEVITEVVYINGVPSNFIVKASAKPSMSLDTNSTASSAASKSDIKTLVPTKAGTHGMAGLHEMYGYYDYD